MAEEKKRELHAVTKAKELCPYVEDVSAFEVNKISDHIDGIQMKAGVTRPNRGSSGHR